MAEASRLSSRRTGKTRSTWRLDSRRLGFVLFIIGLVVAGFFAGLHLGYTTLAGAVVLIVADRREPRDVFARVDWALLVFFCCLFVVVEGLAGTGIVERAWSDAVPYLSLREPGGLAMFTGLMTLGSNLVSNVPMVLLTGPHLGELGPERAGWVLLAFTTTVAGNFTLIGSVANIIVAEGAKTDTRLASSSTSDSGWFPRSWCSPRE